jgi:hypothetical protein
MRYFISKRQVYLDRRFLCRFQKCCDCGERAVFTDAPYDVRGDDKFAKKTRGRESRLKDSKGVGGCGRTGEKRDVGDILIFPLLPI